MTGVEITEFLAARLHEDEAAAKAADEALPWKAVITDDPETTRVLDSQSCTIAGWLSDGDAAHIARHDPARVLGEVEAKRQHLARYQGALLRQQSEPGDERNNGYVVAMSQVLQDDAAVWRDHPDYNPAWALVSA
jgi:hypothetical protein